MNNKIWYCSQLILNFYTASLSFYTGDIAIFKILRQQNKCQLQKNYKPIKYFVLNKLHRKILQSRMNSIDEDVLINSLISNDTDPEFFEKFNCFKLVLDDSYFDYELLKVALDKKRVKIANFLINKGCRVKSPNEDNLGETPLHLAMKLDNYNEYWSQYYDEDVYSDQEWEKDTELHEVSEYSDQEWEKHTELHEVTIITRLLKRGASIYDKNYEGETPLLAAYNQMRFAAIHKVLNFIKNSNFKNLNQDNQDDVLHFYIACLVNHIKSIKLYLAAGFDVVKHLNDISNLSFNYENFTVDLVHQILDSDYDYLIKILIPHSNLAIKNSNELTPLQVIYYDSIFHLRQYAYLENRLIRIFRYGNHSKFNNAVDCNGVSHFYLCCSTNCVDVLQDFINYYGVDVNSSISLNSSRYPGFTPLHLAINNDRVEVVELLLKNGADSNSSDKRGVTPLHLVCSKSLTNERVRIMEMLLEHNSCPTVGDKTGTTPIHLVFDKLFRHCVNTEVENILDKLLSKISPVLNITTEDGISLFHIVCSRSNTDQVNDFINSGVAINSCVLSGKYCGYTPLHFAVLFNQKDVVELLLMRNAQVDIKASNCDIPLHLACEITQSITYEVNNYNYEKVRSNCKSIISLDWALHRKKQLDIIKLLLSHGADINAKDISGCTPLFRACTVDHISASQWPDFLKNIIVNEIIVRLIGVFKILLSNKANVTTCDNLQQTILHFIVINQLPLKILNKLVEQFITAGANVNAVNGDGLTPLHFAVLQNKKELVQVFLNHKADATIKSKENRTPLQTAFKFYVSTNNISMVDVLLENGCDINDRNEDSTLLQNAILVGSDFLVNKFLYYGADINVESDLVNCLLPDRSEEIPTGLMNMLIVIFIHVQKLKGLGFYVHKKIEQFCTRLREYHKKIPKSLFEVSVGIALDECDNELNEMKIRMIDNYTSLYGILLKDPHELSKHLKNESLIEMLERQDTYEAFPQYGYLLKLHYKKGVLRRDVLKSAKASLIYIFGSNLPDLCWDSVLRHLSNKDIINLKAAVSNSFSNKEN